MRHGPLLLGVLLALVVALPADAQTAPPSDPHAAAQAFADATLTLGASVDAEMPAAARRLRGAGSRRCAVAVGRAAAAAHGRKTVLRVAQDVWQYAVLDAVLPPTRSDFRTFVDALDVVQTNDAALVAGREGWHEWEATIRRFPAVSTTLCSRLSRWTASGFRRGKPRYSRTPLRVLSQSGTVDFRVRATVKRLEELGVPAADAKKFTGDDLFSGLSSQINAGR